MAHDSARGRTVLFGGQTAAGLSGDTWEWDGENWTQVADTGPRKRSGHAMAFDSTRGRVVLFGGDGGTRLDDTWEWDGNEWVQQDDTGPSPRVNPAMAYDTGRHRMVLFGGATADPGLGDTWERNGAGWSQESDFGPDPCAGAAMVFKGGSVALFGGVGTLGPFPVNPPAPTVFSRSWEWDGKHWTARQDMGPGPRVFHAMAFDAARSRIVLFGGSPVALNDPVAPQSLFGDTWEEFEIGVSSGGGGGGGTEIVVDITSLDAIPNPVTQGDTLVVTVFLSSPAPALANVPVFIDNDPTNLIATVPIGTGAANGSVSVLIPPNTVTSAVQITLTARSGSSEASMTLTINPLFP
jgi:hypothetical protein